MLNMPEFYVIKENGVKDLFDYGKLENSLRKAGASEELIPEVVSEISKYAHEGITTHDIYNKAYSLA